MISDLIENHRDMVVGARAEREDAAYRRGHRTGNRLLTSFVTTVFGRAFTDILSGYRVFSRRFVKSFPVLSGGFEIETELTVHALELDLPVGEIKTPYFARPEGSASKLNTWRDGFRILWTIFRLYRSERPLQFLLRHRRRARGHLGRPRRSRSSSPISRPARCRACRPPCSSTGLMVVAFLSFRRRPDPRHRHARTPRVQAARLSRPQRGRRAAPRAAQPDRRCAKSSAPTTPC